MIKSYIKAN